MSAPSFDYTIKVAQLDGVTPLPGGDVVSVAESAGTPGVVTFTLTAKKGMWWKGIVYFQSGAGNNWTEIAAGSGDELNDDKYTKKTGTIDHGLMAAGFLTLSRTGGAGVHTNPYLLQDADTAFRAGYTYTVDWKTD